MTQITHYIFGKACHNSRQKQWGKARILLRRNTNFLEEKIRGGENQFRWRNSIAKEGPWELKDTEGAMNCVRVGFQTPGA
jgi:hypothetical protein